MWKQGQHLVLVGDTGQGKTTLARTLLELRRYVVVLLTKADPLAWPGWRRIHRASQIVATPGGARYSLRPRYDEQHEQAEALFARVWSEGGWCVYIDEGYFVERELDLRDGLIKFLTQGRSNNISMVVSVQRPVDITRFLMSQTQHILCAALSDERDLKTIREITGNRAYADFLTTLKKYEFGYYDRQNRRYQTVTRDTVIAALGGQ